MKNPKILDYLGRSIKTSMLIKEIAVPSISSIRSLWYSSVANDLTPENLAAILMQVDQNDIVSYLTLAEEMEERDLHYHSVLSTRRLAVSGLDVVVESYSDDAEDVKIADFVSDVVTDDAFNPLLMGQLDALGKGFAVDEIMWDRSESQWFPLEYKWRDPRHFQFDIETGSELRMRDEADSLNGLALSPYKFCVHRPLIKMGLSIRCGLARLAVVAYMCKGYTIKDWLAFAEVFGMPLRIGKHSSAATAEQKTALLNAVASIGTDAACIIEDTMMIDFVAASKTAGGEKLFKDLGDWLDSQVSKGVLGQTATTQGTPGRLGSDDAQQQVREDIKTDDAGQLASTLRRDIVKPLVDLNFGPRKRGQYPKLKLFTKKPEDLKVLSETLAPLIDRGLPIQASVVLDRIGFPEPEDGADLLKPKGGGMAEPATDEDGNPLPGHGPDDEGKHGPPAGVPRPGHGPDSKRGEPDRQPGGVLQYEQQSAVIEIMGAVRRGEELTPDQRLLLVASMAERQSTTVQTLVLSKERFKSLATAKKWVRDNGYKVPNPEIDETETSYRFRQRDPNDFRPGSFRTITLTEGVKAVIGHLKTEMAAAEPDNGDEIDRLVKNELQDWKRLMDPVLQPMLDHAQASSGYQEFLDGLEEAMAKMDSTALAERLAVSTFKARGRGDGTDDV